MRTKTPIQSEKILAVAARLFATHRFHEARMEDIAAAAGVGKGTLYRYFRDKEELYLALLAGAAEQIGPRLQEAYDRPSNPRCRLEAMVEAILSYFEEQPHLFDLIQHAEVMGSLDRENPWNDARSNTLSLYQAVFQEGEQAGLWRINDPDIAVLLLLGGLRGVLRFGPKPRPPHLAERIVESFLHGHIAPQSLGSCRERSA